MEAISKSQNTHSEKLSLFLTLFEICNACINDSGSQLIQGRWGQSPKVLWLMRYRYADCLCKWVVIIMRGRSFCWLITYVPGSVMDTLPLTAPGLPPRERQEYFTNKNPECQRSWAPCPRSVMQPTWSLWYVINSLGITSCRLGPCRGESIAHWCELGWIVLQCPWLPLLSLCFGLLALMED